MIKLVNQSNNYFFNKRKYCSKSCAAKDRDFTEKTRKKMSIERIKSGRRPPSFHELSPEKQKSALLKRSLYPNPFKGRKHSTETKKMIGDAHRGEKSPKWKGGISLARNYKRMKKYEYLGRKLNATGSHTKMQWTELKAKYGFMCLCCKKVEPEIKLTEDHIIPLSLGGSDFIENIQPLCMPCNSRKSIKKTSYVPVV